MKKKGYMERTKSKRTSFFTSVRIDYLRLSRLLGFDPRKDRVVLDLVKGDKNIKVVLWDDTKPPEENDFSITVSWERDIKTERR